MPLLRLQCQPRRHRRHHRHLQPSAASNLWPWPSQHCTRQQRHRQCRALARWRCKSCAMRSTRSITDKPRGPFATLRAPCCCRPMAILQREEENHSRRRFACRRHQTTLESRRSRRRHNRHSRSWACRLVRHRIHRLLRQRSRSRHRHRRSRRRHHHHCRHSSSRCAPTLSRRGLAAVRQARIHPMTPKGWLPRSPRGVA